MSTDWWSCPKRDYVKLMEENAQLKKENLKYEKAILKLRTFFGVKSKC